MSAPMKWFLIDSARMIAGEFDTEAEARSAYNSALALGWRVTSTASVYSAPSRQHMEAHLAKVVQLVCAGSGAGYWEDHERIDTCAACGAQTKDDDGTYCPESYGDEHDWRGVDVLRETSPISGGSQ